MTPCREFVVFLEGLVVRTPPAQQIHTVLDNLSAHKAATIREFLKRHPRVRFHFVPTESNFIYTIKALVKKGRARGRMGKAYSDDLRRKVLERHEKGEDTLEDLADQFGVSLGWVYKISAAFARTGKMERPLPARVGRKRKATPEIEQFISETVQARSDITLAGLQGSFPRSSSWS